MTKKSRAFQNYFEKSDDFKIDSEIFNGNKSKVKNTNFKGSAV